MDQRKQRAKQLCRNGEFKDAKQIMLQIIKDGERSYKLLMKLGDVLVHLHEFHDALRYYQLSLDKNANNSLIYRKIGNLFGQHLNDRNKAVQMYQKCIELSPNDELCWFNYGKLSFKQNNFGLSEKCYLKCSTPRACVNYHYALLLLSKEPKLSQKALNLLLNATRLKPNIAKYHYQYALCAKEMGLFEDAKKAFIQALKLSQYKDAQILYDYAMFVSDSMQNHQTALSHLNIALSLSESNDYPYIQKEYGKLSQFLSQRVHKQKTKDNIKLIIYDFDETITYWNLWRRIKGDINNLKYMNNTELIHFVFGGDDRLQRLRLHFQRIHSSENKIQTAILSQNHSNIIILALKRVGLLKYFAKLDILGSDTSQDLRNRNKMPDLIQLAHAYKVHRTQVLLIDDSDQHIDSASNYCHTFHVFSKHTLNGLSMPHMKEIEKLVGVYANDNYDFEPEISVNSLAKLFQQIPANHFWTMANILPILLDMLTADTGFILQYANVLTKLHHYREAEIHFQKAIELNPNPKHHLEYGYFLLRCNEYVKAGDVFRYIIDNHLKEVKNKSTLYLVFAEVLHNLYQINGAEKYYKLAIDSGPMDSCAVHNRYGNFLHSEKRYKESLEQFTLSMQRNEANVNNHYDISKPLYEMCMFTAYEYHLKRALKVNPLCHKAKEKLNAYYLNEEKAEMKDANNIAFDIFWFDEINKCTPEFNNYFDKFGHNQKNNIRFLLYDSQIESELEKIIGINSKQDIQLIMRHVTKLRNAHQEFVNKLKESELSEYYPIFEHNGIYTTKSLLLNVSCAKDFNELIRCYNKSEQSVKQFAVNKGKFHLIKFLACK